MKDRYSFIAVFTQEDSGISIEFPDLPGCYPCASSMDEALANAKEALGLHLWGMEQDNEKIPEPSSIATVHLAAGQVPALIEIFMSPVREKISNRFTRKNVSLPSYLAAMADKDNVNCSQLLQKALIDYLGIEGVER